MPLGRPTDENKLKFLDIPEDPEGEKLVGIPEDSEAEHEDEWVESKESMESVIEIEVEGRVAETGCGRSSRPATTVQSGAEQREVVVEGRHMRKESIHM